MATTLGTVMAHWRTRPSDVIGYPVVEHQGGAEQESDAAGNRADEQQAREREALKRRVRESLLRCPGAET
jgi:hypothetical protein